MKPSPEEQNNRPREFPVWKEITPDPEITSDKTAIEKLETEGHKIDDYSKDMLSKVDWKEKLKSSYQVVSVSVGELFQDEATHTYPEIKAKAQENGLDLVPAKLAPSIRENYEKNGEYTVIAMEAIHGRGGHLMLFDCNNNSESQLSFITGRDDVEWGDSNRFFFIRK
jgi:hypothetical protein